MANSFSPHIYPFNSHCLTSALRCIVSPNEVSWILDFRKQEGTQEMEAPLQEKEERLSFGVR